MGDIFLQNILIELRGILMNLDFLLSDYIAKEHYLYVLIYNKNYLVFYEQDMFSIRNFSLSK